MATFINGYLVEKEERSFSRWQRLARSIASITIAFPANPPDRYTRVSKILLCVFAKPVHFTIRKSAKVRYACGYLHRRRIQLQPEQGLDIIMQTRYNIGTKYIVCVCRSVLWLSDAHFLFRFQGTLFGFG